MFDLHEQFGDIDIYLFDQILRGRIARGMRVMDAGCGGGRNLVYLMRAGYEVFGMDALDSGRAASPLRAADDALVLDTTGRSIDDVVAEIVERFRARVPEAT